MESAERRSTEVTSTLTVPLTASRSRVTLDFEALYRASAEDVTALAFERAYRKRRSYNARRGSERAWLFGIARNAALDELRRRKRAAALAADPADVDAAPPEDVAEAALRRAAVRVALARIAARDRELIALKFHAG